MSTNNPINPTASFDASELIALLSEKRDLCVQLGELADSQRSLITGDDPERLLSVLGDRQKILDQMGVLKARLEPYQQNWHEVRSQLTENQGQQVDQLVSEVNTLLSAILAKDEADTQLLAARKSSTSKAMAELKTGRQAGVAYAAADGTDQSLVEWTDE